MYINTEYAVRTRYCQQCSNLIPKGECCAKITFYKNGGSICASCFEYLHKAMKMCNSKRFRKSTKSNSQ